jgi:hypothetical protein
MKKWGRVSSFTGPGPNDPDQASLDKNTGKHDSRGLFFHHNARMARAGYPSIPVGAIPVSSKLTRFNGA